MERQFNACQSPRSMYLSIINSFRVIRCLSQCVSPKIAIFTTFLLGYPMVKKFRRYLYLFWPNSRTWQTDGRTDRQTDTACRHIPHLCITSRGKNRTVFAKVMLKWKRVQFFWLTVYIEFSLNLLIYSMLRYYNINCKIVTILFYLLITQLKVYNRTINQSINQ